MGMEEKCIYLFCLQVAVMQMIIIYLFWVGKIYGGFMPEFLFKILIYFIYNYI